METSVHKGVVIVVTGGFYSKPSLTLQITCDNMETSVHKGVVTVVTGGFHSKPSLTLQDMYDGPFFFTCKDWGRMFDQ